MEVFNAKKFSAACQHTNGLVVNPFYQSTSNAQERVQNLSRPTVAQHPFSGYPCKTQSAYPGERRNPKKDRLHQPVFFIPDETDAVPSLLKN
jgi:hypothetical protein